MKSSHDQSQPARVIAEFGSKSNPKSPLFLVERGSGDDLSVFRFRDADEIGGTLATARVESIDPDTKAVDLDLEVDSRPADFAYRMTVSDMQRGLRAVLKECGAETAHFPHTNVSKESLLQIGHMATPNNVVEFSLRPEPTESVAA